MGSVIGKHVILVPILATVIGFTCGVSMVRSQEGAEDTVLESPTRLVKRSKNGLPKEEYSVTLDGSGTATKCGPAFTYDDDGRVRAVGVYKNGSPNGTRLGLRSDGKPFGTYQYNASGQPHGEFLGWHENGALAERCFWRNGIQKGALRGYYPNGKRRGFVIIERTVHTGPDVAWYPSGEIKRVSHYESGREVIRIEFNEDGEPYKVSRFHAAPPSGSRSSPAVSREQVWHSNGLLAQERAYNEKGEPHGTWQEWDAEEVLVAEIRYENGKQVK